MRTIIYDWNEFDSDGLLYMYIGRDGLEMLLEYYNVKIAALVQDKSVDEISANLDEVDRLIKERQAIIDKLREGNEDDKEV